VRARLAVGAVVRDDLEVAREERLAGHDEAPGLRRDLACGYAEIRRRMGEKNTKNHRTKNEDRCPLIWNAIPSPWMGLCPGAAPIWPAGAPRRRKQNKGQKQYRKLAKKN